MSPGPRLLSGRREVPLGDIPRVIRTRSTLMPVLIYIMLTFAGRSFHAYAAVLYPLRNIEERRLSIARTQASSQKQTANVHGFLIP